MENQHYSNSKSLNKEVGLNCSKEVLTRLCAHTKLQLFQDLNSNLRVNEGDKYLSLSAGSLNINLKPSEIDFYLEKINSIPSKSKSKSKSSLANVTKVNKKLFKSFELIDLLNIYWEGSKDTIDFCRMLLKLKKAKNFEIIHLFINEKGRSQSIHREITSNNFKSKTIPTSDFNSLMFSVKKSRNRSYGQKELKGNEHGIIGTFLAHEFSLANFNVIFAFSRNDFLSQTEDELLFFNEIKLYIPSYLELLLDKENEFKKLKNLRMVFDNIPIKFQLSSQSNIENKANKIPSGLFYKCIDKELDSINHADIYHNERVALLGELLNTLRHELSNPLFGLQLSSQILQEEIDKDNKPLIEEITHSISRSQEIINNFTKLYSKSDEKLEVNLYKLVKEVLTLTKSESRNVHVDIDIPQEVEILTNPVWMAQILFNLIINSSQALKASNIASPEIKIRYTKSSESEFLIDFSDNGLGISKSYIDKIFSPFFTTKEKGTGLGLAITKMLVERLSGSIQYCDQFTGAYFKLRFKN